LLRRNLIYGLVATGLLALPCWAERWQPKTQTCPAQRYQPNTERNTVESWIIQQVSLEPDSEKKLALLGQFVDQYPKDESIGWVYDKMYSLLAETKQFDRALAVGEKLLALDPDDLEIIHKNLKIAETKKEPALITKWSESAAQTARRITASVPVSEACRGLLELARQVLTYTEYLSYTEILQTANRTKKVELMARFVQHNAPSPYLPLVQNLYVATMQEMGDSQKAVAMAEKILERDPSNEDLLIMVAENYWRREKDQEQAKAYAAKALALMDQKAKPDGVADGDWSKKKAQLTGRAHWIIGSLAMQQSQFAQADRSLRAALPFLKGGQLASAALFYLGWANYKLGNIPDAIRFNRQCQAIKGPYQLQAGKNLGVITAENPGSN
jgi:tetratricopeptide (TPR) repeat protein